MCQIFHVQCFFDSYPQPLYVFGLSPSLIMFEVTMLLKRYWYTNSMPDIMLYRIPLWDELTTSWCELMVNPTIITAWLGPHSIMLSYRIRFNIRPYFNSKARISLIWTKMKKLFAFYFSWSRDKTDTMYTGDFKWSCCICTLYMLDNWHFVEM